METWQALVLILFMYIYVLSKALETKIKLLPLRSPKAKATRDQNVVTMRAIHDDSHHWGFAAAVMPEKHFKRKSASKALSGLNACPQVSPLATLQDGVVQISIFCFQDKRSYEICYEWSEAYKINAFRRETVSKHNFPLSTPKTSRSFC